VVVLEMSFNLGGDIGVGGCWLMVLKVGLGLVVGFWCLFGVSFGCFAYIQRLYLVIYG